MHVGREGAGLVAIGDHLYCIGKCENKIMKIEGFLNEINSSFCFHR